MPTKRRMVATTAAFAAAALITGLGTQALQVADATDSGTSQSGLHARVISRQLLPYGQERVVWQVNGHRVTYTGPRGAKVTTDRVTNNPDGSGYASSGVTIPDQKGTDPLVLAQQYAKAHGFTLTQDEINRAKGVNTTAASRATAQAVASEGPIIADWCVGWQDWDHDKIHAKTCNVRRLDYKASSTNWYVVDSTMGSAYSSDCCIATDPLIGYAATVRYWDAKNVILNWQPSSTQSVGACGTKTTSVTSKSGANYSQSTTICPEKFGPWSHTNQQTGAKWTGKAGQDQWRDVMNNMFTHSPSGATLSSTLTHYVWWT